MYLSGFVECIAFMQCVAESGYDCDDEASDHGDSVGNGQDEEFAADVIVTPNLAKVDDELSDDEEIFVCPCSHLCAVKLSYALCLFYHIALLSCKI
jgi:hypothetical protein